ncbi:MAG: ferrochelatase [Xanthomonadaceae bacterium]|nr:ferrochelatase [Xanthomonadaceae bacterium]MDE1884835.1 ferrochelatase [Xanthomonadaceae bacterium]MDE1961115.1 ferrochelatase [Xanthomonadaceae bacterium]MDE2083973.1 ferrochelatase [Xanthomonadaceae bacterium]MDE2258408.1 ferrochelatase [Xanthomonadaceae bacterium]
MPDSSRASSPATTVLLVNLGTPAAPTASAVRRYLAQFLSDRRVIDYPRWLWLPLLYGVILRLRPRRSARAYAKIWTAQGSPLLVNNRALAAKLASELSNEEIRVELAMTYGEPDVPATIRKLLAEGVRRLLVLPLYPQYSATSTAAVFDAAFAALRAERRLPEIRCIADYHAEPAYIDALSASVEKYWLTHGRGERLLLSFHGIPERYVNAGDPYRGQCLTTARLLRERLGVSESELTVAFQSRVGRERWLTPYTDAVLPELASAGARHVQVLCPGFAVDCLETLEEIAIRGRGQFLAAGGKRLDYIPALNDSPSHVRLLHELIERHTQGWTVGGA